MYDIEQCPWCEIDQKDVINIRSLERFRGMVNSSGTFKAVLSAREVTSVRSKNCGVFSNSGELIKISISANIEGCHFFSLDW